MAIRFLQFGDPLITQGIDWHNDRLWDKRSHVLLEG